MGRGNYLTTTEKSTIVRLCAEGRSISNIAKQLSRFHRLVKKFLLNSTKIRQISDKGNIDQLKRKI